MKYLVVVFLALFALQGAYGNELEQLHHEKALSAVIKLVEKLIYVIKEAAEHLIGQLQPFITQVIDLAKDTITGAGHVVTEVIDAALITIEVLVNKTQELGLDISSCPVKPAIAGLQALLIPAVENITACANQTLTDVNKVSEVLTGFIQSFIDEALEILEEAKHCPGGLVGELLCLPPIVAELGLLVLNVPLKIAAKLPELTKTLQNLINNLVTCTTGIIDGITFEATDLIQEVVTCLTDIINEHGGL